MAHWSGKSCGFAKATWKAPAVAVRDAMATADGTGPMTVESTALWAAAATAADLLIDAMVLDKSDLSVDIDVATDPKFKSITVTVQRKV